jgi:TolB-like protein
MSFFTELQRRNVVRVGVAYTLIAWVVAQVAEFAFENFGAPEWVIKVIVVLLLLGLPVALVFAWIYEMTPEGIKKEKDVDRSASITPDTGRRIDRVIIVVLVVALGFFAFDKYARDATPEAPPEAAAVERPAQPVETDSGVLEKSVAVLPFVAMSDGPDDEFFADGLTEEILNSLAQLPELLVTARTSAFMFKGDDLPSIPEIADRLGVKHVVEGSVRRSGDRLRVTAQLIRASDGFHLWSNNYDSTSADTIEVQEDIAEKIAVALDIVLDEAKSAAMRQAGLRDVEAFTAFQKAWALFEEAHGEVEMISGLRAGNLLLDQVIERAPTFSTAYVLHSDLFFHLLNDDVFKVDGDKLSTEEIAEARGALIDDYEAATTHSRNKAIRLQNETDLAFIEGSWRGLAARTRRSLAADTCMGGNWAPTIANVLGLAAEHVEQQKRIVACDPLRPLPWINLVRAIAWTGDFDAALDAAREGRQLIQGNNWLDWMYVRTLIDSGRFELAQEAIDSQMQDPVWTQSARVLLAARQGDRDGFARAMADYDINVESTMFGGTVYAWGGLREDANRMAERYDKHPWGPWVLWQISLWCACDSPFDLEVTPNFARMIKDAEIPWPPRSGREYPLKDW